MCVCVCACVCACACVCVCVCVRLCAMCMLYGVSRSALRSIAAVYICVCLCAMCMCHFHQSIGAGSITPHCCTPHQRHMLFKPQTWHDRQEQGKYPQTGRLQRTHRKWAAKPQCAQVSGVGVMGGVTGGGGGTSMTTSWGSLSLSDSVKSGGVAEVTTSEGSDVWLYLYTPGALGLIY